jgi:hypothetical protein
VSGSSYTFGAGVVIERTVAEVFRVHLLIAKRSELMRSPGKVGPSMY